jgi:vacuolar-type H+-ATPase subunit I/STV1
MKLWASLTEQEKATLRYLETQDQLAKLLNTVGEGATSNLQAFTSLQAAASNLAAAIGEKLLPVAAAAASVLTDMTQAAQGTLDVLSDLASFDPSKILAALEEIRQHGGVMGAGRNRAQVQREAAEAAAETKKAQETAEATADAAAKAADIKEKARARQEVENRKNAAEEIADVEIKDDMVKRLRAGQPSIEASDMTKFQPSWKKR